MKLDESEYDSQVVDAEPEILDFDVSNMSKSVRDELARNIEAEFEVNTAPKYTNWDRSLSYPRNATIDYSYHNNLYRQLINYDSETIQLSWIQAMDLAYVANDINATSIAKRLEKFAKEFDEQSGRSD